MCEHEWTIVYIGDEPIGIACMHCKESRATQEPEEPLPVLGLLSGGTYRIPTGSGSAEFWVLENWHLQSELMRPSQLVLEFVQAVPPSSPPFSYGGR